MAEQNAQVLQFPGNNYRYPLVCKKCKGHGWGIFFKDQVSMEIEYVECLGCGLRAVIIEKGEKVSS